MVVAKYKGGTRQASDENGVMTMNMSFFMTRKQIEDGSKTVTRRMGWHNLRAGTVVTAVYKCQGLKKGEKVEVLREITVEDVRRERLDSITQEEVVREGFPRLTVEEFIELFCKMNKCTPSTVITRIQFK